MECPICLASISDGDKRCTSCGAGLPVPCVSCGKSNAFEAKYCIECGRPLNADLPRQASYSSSLTHPDSPLGIYSERRPLTVMFCDLVGSTELADRVDAEDVQQVFREFRDCVARVVAQFDGTVAEHKGDAVVVHYGNPRAHEDDAERAIRTGLQAVEELARLTLAEGYRPQIRIGIATGMVVIDATSSKDAAEVQSAVGATVNLAARLQTSAEPNTVVIADSTWRLAGGFFECRNLGFLNLKGLREPVQAWQVLGARSVTSRFDAQRDGLLPPMLGRNDSRDMLLELWGRACDGAGQVALISAEAGVGKSRLAASILEEIGQDIHATLRYFCTPHRQGSPLHPCIQQLEHAAGFSKNDTHETKLAKLEAALEGVLQSDLGLIAELLNLPGEGRFPGSTLSPKAKRLRTMQILIAQLEGVARQTPVLMIFEDAQWSDETSRELLSLVVSRVSHLPVLLLVMTRPEFRPEWAARKHVTCASLFPLSREISVELVRRVAGDRPLPPKVVADIVTRTDGVPLFLEEITQAVVENRDSRAPTATSVRENTSALPLSLQASLLSRLDRLGRAREIAEIAAAIGREFTSDLLALVVEDVRDLQGLLDRLVGSGLVLRRGGQQAGYLFKHELIRDAAYSLMTRDKRRVLHLRIAEALEKNYPETATNHPEILAWHYTECRLIRKAVELWLDAGRQKLVRSAMAEALKHLERGIELVGEVEDSPWRVEKEFILTIAKGKALIATQGYAKESTRETFEKARILCERMGEPPQLLAVLHGLWTHELLRGNLPSAHKQATHVLDRGVATDTVHKKMWLLMGHRFSGVTNHPMGNFCAATDLLKSGLEYYDPDPKMKKIYADLTVDDPCVVMKTYLSWSLMCRGEFSEARRYSDEAVAEAREMAHIYTLAHALNGAAFVALTISTPDVALRKLDELASILTDNGIAYYEAVEIIFRGWCFAAVGEFEKALPLLSSGMDAYRETGSLLYLSGFLRMSAEAHCWADRCDLAMDMIQESKTIMESTAQWWDHAEILRVQAMLMRINGDSDVAEEILMHACLVAKNQGARLWELRASCDLAELLEQRGERALGREVLIPVVEPFASQSDIPDLGRARSFL